MNKGLVIGILVVLALAAVVVIATRPNNTGYTVANMNTPSQTNSTSSNSIASMKFSDSPYYHYSYLISGGALSSQAQRALAGFNLSATQNSDGTTTYTLTALESGYVSQTYTLQPGQSLYFLEGSMGDDDTMGNLDYNLGDDNAIVVDSNGNIVQ